MLYVAISAVRFPGGGGGNWAYDASIALLPREWKIQGSRRRTRFLDAPTF